MNENNGKYKHMRAAAHITQFGLNMVTPIVLCTLISVWLENKFDIGGWVIALGIGLGIAASGVNMVNFMKTVKKEMGGKTDDKERKD